MSDTPIDYRELGRHHFEKGSKSEKIFHRSDDSGRLYREGWHAARRAAELAPPTPAPVAYTPPALIFPPPPPPPPAKVPAPKKSDPDQLDLFS